MEDRNTVIVRAKVNKEALGRTWLDDAALRSSLELDPEIVFIYTPRAAGWPDQWAIKYNARSTLAPITLVEGRRAGLLFGAELFRRLTGKEVDLGLN